VVEVEVSRGNHYAKLPAEQLSRKVVEWNSKKQTPIYFVFVTNRKRTLSQKDVENFYRNRGLALVAPTFFFSCKEESCSKR